MTKLMEQKNKAKIQKYFDGQKNVLAVYLYGSFANGTPTKLSDIDFGIALKKPISASKAFDLQLKYTGEISDLIRKDIKFDYVDAVILNTAPPLLKQQAIINGKLIYTLDDDKRVEFETNVLKEYDDAMHLRETYYYYLQKQAKTGVLGEKYAFKR